MIYTNYEATPTPDLKNREFYQATEATTAEHEVYVEELIPPWIRIPTFIDATITVHGSSMIQGVSPTAHKNPICRNIQRVRWIRYCTLGSNQQVEQHCVQGYTLTGRSGTTFTDGGDADGAASNAAGTEAANNEATGHKFTWTTGQAQPRWGYYYATRFKLPSTMTSLANRVFYCTALGSNATGFGDIGAADTGGTATEAYIALRYRADTDATANWWVRCGDASNDANLLDTGVAVATDTLYDVEFWCTTGTAPTHYVRINGGAAQRFSGTGIPAANSAAMLGCQQIWGRNTAAVTGTGAIAVRSYNLCMYL